MAQNGPGPQGTTGYSWIPGKNKMAALSSAVLGLGVPQPTACPAPQQITGRARSPSKPSSAALRWSSTMVPPSSWCPSLSWAWCEPRAPSFSHCSHQHHHTHLDSWLPAVCQLELGNLYQQGEINRLATIALQTDLTFDLVGHYPSPDLPHTPHIDLNPSSFTARPCLLHLHACPAHPVLHADVHSCRQPSWAMPSCMYAHTARGTACPLPACLQVTIAGCLFLLAVAILSYFLLQTRPVYLMDFQLYRAPDRYVGLYRAPERYVGLYRAPESYVGLGSCGCMSCWGRLTQHTVHPSGPHPVHPSGPRPVHPSGPHPVHPSGPHS